MQDNALFVQRDAHKVSLTHAFDCVNTCAQSVTCLEEHTAQLTT